MSDNNNNNSNTTDQQEVTVPAIQIPTFSQVSIQPLVIFSILDAYMRRNTESSKVMGSLLGRIENGVIYVENSFSVPYVEEEDKEKLPNLENHNSLLEVYQKISPQLELVGWYLTGATLGEDSSDIQSFYNDEQAPLHVLVDTDLTGNKLDIKSFVSASVVFEKQTLGTQFFEVSTRFETTTTSETNVLKNLSKTTLSNPTTVFNPTALFSLEHSLENLLEMLDTVSQYVEKVVEKKIEGDPRIGQMISNVLNSFPQIDPKNLETLFNNNIQDLLLIVYLANLTRTQIAISEKLHSLI